MGPIVKKSKTFIQERTMSLEDELRNDPKSLAQKYSFCPNNPSFSEWTFGANQVKKTPLKGEYAGFNRFNLDEDFLIAKLGLEFGMSARGECLMVTPSFKEGAPGVPAYFLPWDNRGAAVRIRIPDLDPNLPDAEHPKLFMTAALSGCSIIFKGTPQKPTIYHCGTEGNGVGTDTKGESNDFFRAMLTGPPYRAIGGQIKSTDYMVPNSGSAGMTLMEKNFLEALKGQNHLNAKGIGVRKVSTWGACFGIRTGRDWKFYLQKNATISFNQAQLVTATKEVEKKVFFGLRSKTEEQSYITTRMIPGKPVCKPIEIERVFPGTGVAKPTSYWSMTQIKGI
jgi:hypothetical protein